MKQHNLLKFFTMVTILARLATTAYAAEPNKLQELFQKFGNAEFLVESARISPIQIRSLTTRQNATEICNLIDTHWTDFITQLTAATMPMPHKQIVTTNVLKTFGILCMTSLTQLNTKVADISKSIGNNYPTETVRKILQEELWFAINNNTYHTKNWLFHEISTGMRRAECTSFSKTTLPAVPECWGVWAANATELLQNTKLLTESKILADTFTEAVAKSRVPLLVLPKLFTQIPNRQTLWKKIFNQAPIESATLILSSAQNLLLVYDQQLIGAPKTCDTARHISAAIAQKIGQGSVASEWSIALAGKLILNLCSQTPDLIRTSRMQIQEVLLKQIQRSQPEISSTDTELQTEAENFFTLDNQLRQSLQLFFRVGASLDAEELKTYPSTVRSTDELLGAFLRQIDSIPWVALHDATEELDTRRDYTKQLLIASGDFPGRRLVQLLYLREFWRQEGSESSIRSIRELSTSIASRVPRLIYLADAIHNGLHPGIIKQVQDAMTSLSSGEQSQIGDTLSKLTEELRKFFANANLNAKTATLQQEIDAAIHLLDDCAKLERETGHKKLTETDATFYIAILQQLSAKHDAIIARLGSPGLTSLSTSETVSLARYLQQLAETKLSSTKNLDTLTQALQRQLQNIFSPRQERLRWYLLAQMPASQRSTTSAAALVQRLYALDAFGEKMVRDLGMHLVARFAPPSPTMSTRVMNIGIGVGRLVFVPSAQLERYPFSKDEVIITDGIPRDLSVVAGLITEVFQPRASHIDLRTKEYEIPNAFVKNAQKKWESLLGTRVRLTVKEGQVLIEPAGGQQDTVVSASVPLDLPVALRTGSREPITLDQDITTLEQVGAKAFGYSHLRKLWRQQKYVAPAFALPFSAYFDFVTTYNLQPEIERILSLPKNPDTLKKALIELQQKFTEAAANQKFLESAWYKNLWPSLAKLVVQTQQEGHQSQWVPGCFRFRSSTNAEDLVNLSGAGLYESATGCLEATTPKNTLSHALGKVWGSLWSYKAFMDREYHGINHRDIGMAILVHRNWSAEKLNGVLITRSQLDPTSFISVQPGEDLVTNPTGTRNGDEIAAALVQQDVSIVNEQYANPTPLLSPAELRTLLEVAEKSHAYFKRVFANAPRAATQRFDLEFKWEENETGERKLILKQARPLAK